MSYVAQKTTQLLERKRIYRTALKTVSFSAYLIPLSLSNFLIVNLILQINQLYPRKESDKFLSPKVQVTEEKDRYSEIRQL